MAKKRVTKTRERGVTNEKIMSFLVAMDERITNMDERMATKDGIARLDSRIDGMEERMAAGFAAVNARLDHITSEITHINRRLDHLEEAVGHMRGFSKEIDEPCSQMNDLARQVAELRKAHK